MPWGSVAVTTCILVVFVATSFRVTVARRGLGPVSLARPPIYGDYVPYLGWTVLWGAMALAGLVVIAWVWPRVPDRWVPAAGYAALVTASAAIAMETGQRGRIFAGYDRSAEVREVRRVARLGVREYISTYASRELPQSLSNHPPGRAVMRAAFEQVFGHGVVGPSIVLCLVAGLVVLPTWALAREVWGIDVARAAVLLLATSPAMLLFGWASWEGFEAPLLITSVFLLVRGVLGPRARPGWALAGGLVLGLSTFWTYSGAFVGIPLVLLVLVGRKLDRAGAVAAAGVGVVLALAALWLALGDNVVHTYLMGRQAPELRIATRVAEGRMRDARYWTVGGPVAWLVGAGAPMVALGGRALRRIPTSRALLAVLGPLVVFHSLPARLTGLIQGELERTWLWVYPLAAVVAGAALVDIVGRGTGSDHRRWTRLVPGLVCVSAATAMVIEALWNLPA